MNHSPLAMVALVSTFLCLCCAVVVLLVRRQNRPQGAFNALGSALLFTGMLELEMRWHPGAGILLAALGSVLLFASSTYFLVQRSR